MRDHVTNLIYKVYNRKARNFAYHPFNYLSDMFIPECIIPLTKWNFPCSRTQYQEYKAISIQVSRINWNIAVNWRSGINDSSRWMKSGATERGGWKRKTKRRGNARECGRKFWLTIRGGGAFGRERVKSIGVMTRGKAEAKYFPSRWENLRFRDREREMCGEKRARLRGSEGRAGEGRDSGRVECIYIVAPFELYRALSSLSCPHERKKNFRPALSLKSRWKSLTTLNYGAGGITRGATGASANGFRRDKAAFAGSESQSAGGGYHRYFARYSYLSARARARAKSADICGRMNHPDLGNSNCRRNFHPRLRSLTLNFA